MPALREDLAGLRWLASTSTSDTTEPATTAKADLMPSEASKFASLLEASRAGMPWRRDGDVAPTVVLDAEVPTGMRNVHIIDAFNNERIVAIKEGATLTLTEGEQVAGWSDYPWPKVVHETTTGVQLRIEALLIEIRDLLKEPK